MELQFQIKSDRFKTSILLIQNQDFWLIQQEWQMLVKHFCPFSFFSNQNIVKIEERKFKVINQQQRLSLITIVLNKNKQDIKLTVNQKCILSSRQSTFIYDIYSNSKRQPRSTQQFKFIISKASEISSNGKTIRNFIQIEFQSQHTELLKTIFSELFCQKHDNKLQSLKFHCLHLRTNETQIPYMSQFKSISAQSSNKIGLSINQRNMLEFDYLSEIIYKIIASGYQISFLFGHAATIFINFILVKNIQPSILNQINNLLTFKILKSNLHNKQNQSKQQGQTTEQINCLKHILLILLGEQNILEDQFIQFLCQSVVNEQIIGIFKELISEYYNIFLKSDIFNYSKFFFSQKNRPKDEEEKSIIYFSSLFKYIEWEYTIQVQRIFSQISKHFFKQSFQQITLLDLFNLTNCQYTFIGLDITDGIPRFFNYSTTPLLPIYYLIKLIQVLPTPYKSLKWRRQWGKYRIKYENKIRQIDITGHQIIQSTFLLHNPLDFLYNNKFRRIYFGLQNSSIKIQGLTSVKFDFKDFEQSDRLKQLIIKMKKSAVNAIPKFKLFWKIITMKLKIDIDFNNIDSLKQIHYCSKILNIEKSYKNYLNNLNKQMAGQSIITLNVLPPPFKFESIQQMFKSAEGVLDCLKWLISNYHYNQELHQKQFNFYLRYVYKKLHFIETLTIKQLYQIYLELKRLMKNYQFNGNQLNEVQIEKQFTNLYVDYKAIKTYLKKNLSYFILSIRESLLKSNVSRQSQDFEIVKKYKMNEINHIQIIQIVNLIFKQISNFINIKQKTFRKQLDSIERIRAQYECLIFKQFKKLNQIFQPISDYSEIKQFKKRIYQFTHQFYSINELQLYQKVILLDLKAKMRWMKQDANLTIFLDGRENGQLCTVEQLFILDSLLKDQFNQMKLFRAIGCQYSSIILVLYVLGLERQCLQFEAVKMRHLVSFNSNIIKQQQICLTQMLRKDAKQGDSKINKQRFCQMLLNKYNNLQGLYRQLEMNISNSQYINLEYVISNIEYFEQLSRQFSVFATENQIKSYLQQILVQLKKQSVLINSINKNKNQLIQKIKRNRLNIQLIIKLVQKQKIKEQYWVNIYMEKYKNIDILKQYLTQLFIRLDLSPKITLLELEQVKKRKIELLFVLMNHTHGFYQFFNFQSHPNLMVIDIILASMSLPIDFKPYPLHPSINYNIYSKNIINAINKTVQQPIPQNKYWSSYPANIFPLINIEHKLENEDYLLFELNYYNTIQDKMISDRQKRIQRQNSKKLNPFNMIEGLWSKPKKLSPDLKLYFFNSVINSPFLHYLFFLQGSSYNQLIKIKYSNYVYDLRQISKNQYGNLGKSIFLKNQQSIFITKKNLLNIGLTIKSQDGKFKCKFNKMIGYDCIILYSKQMKNIQAKSNQYFQINHQQSLLFDVYIFHTQTQMIKIQMICKQIKREVNNFQIFIKKENDYLVLLNHEFDDQFRKQSQIIFISCSNFFYLLCEKCFRIEINKNERTSSVCHICRHSILVTKHQINKLYLVTEDNLLPEKSMVRQEQRKQNNSIWRRICFFC